jgi:hypothetical protein
MKPNVTCRHDTLCNIYFLGNVSHLNPELHHTYEMYFNLPLISITHLKSTQNIHTNELCWYFKANLHLKALTASQTLGLCKPVCKHWISVLKPLACVGSTEVRYCTHGLFEPRSGNWWFCEVYASFLPHEWRTMYMNTHQHFLQISNLLSIHDFSSALTKDWLYVMCRLMFVVENRECHNWKPVYVLVSVVKWWLNTLS